EQHDDQIERADAEHLKQDTDHLLATHCGVQLGLFSRRQCGVCLAHCCSPAANCAAEAWVFASPRSSPATRPWRITSSRSHRSTASSISDVTTRAGQPCLAVVLKNAWI